MLDSIGSCDPAAFEMTTDIGVEQETGHPDLREALVLAVAEIEPTEIVLKGVTRP